MFWLQIQYFLDTEEKGAKGSSEAEKQVQA